MEKETEGLVAQWLSQYATDQKVVNPDPIIIKAATVGLLGKALTLMLMLVTLD